MSKPLECPQCGAVVRKYSNPFPTADVIIYHPDQGVVLIERGNTPLGMALPGGFIEEGESAEQAAMREMKEETGLDVQLHGILGVYSRPGRDPRFHTLTVVYVGSTDAPELVHAGDDAAQAAFYPLDALPGPLCFDHGEVLAHFQEYLAGKRQLATCAS